LLLLLAGCQQEMARQPAYRPLQPTSFFEDGRSARPLVEGTVPRGARRDSGLRPGDRADLQRVVTILGSLPANLWTAAASTTGWSLYVEEFPAPLTESMLQRGQERFNIYCAVCHDRVGTGRGMVVQRGFTAPPSFHTDLSRGFKLRGITLPLREAPIGYYFEVITHGFGAMPDHAAQIRPDDRWAIIAYIRALQLSQRASLNDVPEGEKRRLPPSGKSQP
jgi:mono/diheme cytochrome c family protein